jgi:hypothetical protein
MERYQHQPLVKPALNAHAQHQLRLETIETRTGMSHTQFNQLTNK